jgi:hypothetical protein
MTTKEALSKAMSNAAAHCNRVRALLSLSRVISAEVFYIHAGQHPSTMERDLQWADKEFEQAKADYETHCKEINEPAYATWND